MISTALDVHQLVEASSHLQNLVHGKNSEAAALGCLGIAVKSPGLVTCSEMPAGVVAGNEIPAGVTVMLDSVDVTLGRDLLVKTRLSDVQGSPASGLKVRVRFFCFQQPVQSCQLNVL